jgi:NAD(P)H-flavin reductase
MSNLMQPETYRVRSYRKETLDTFTLDLVPETGRVPFQFIPGQFNMLYAFGAGEVPISISGNPAHGDRCVHTIRAVGPVTRLLRELKPGSTVGLRGPFGAPWPVDRAQGKDVIVIAGGIGLAPLRPVIYHVLKNRAQYGRLTLLYGARTPRDILYPGELNRWQKRKDMQVEVTVDTADPEWKGNVGVVPKLITRAKFDPLHAVAMICGPEIMMRYVIPGLQRLGMSDDRIFVSMERNMKCAIGFCGHCQYGGVFICKDGPIFSFDRVREVFLRKEF